MELSDGLHCSSLKHEDKTEAYTLYVIRQQREGIFTVCTVGANQSRNGRQVSGPNHTRQMKDPK